MRGTLVIAGKELKQLFSSPIAYVALAMFFVIAGFLYFSLVGVYSVQVLQLQGAPRPISTRRGSSSLRSFRTSLLS